MPVAELRDRVGWLEFQSWIEFYAWEAEQQMPPNKRRVRARTPAEAAAALDRIAAPRLKDAAEIAATKGRRRGK